MMLVIIAEVLLTVVLEQLWKAEPLFINLIEQKARNEASEDLEG